MNTISKPVIITFAFLILLSVAFGKLINTEKRQKEAWENARVVLVTKQGIPAHYHGYKIVYEKSLTANGFSIALSVNDHKMVIDPGEQLSRICWDKRGWGFSSSIDDETLSQFAFYLPNGEKLRLKAVSSDLLDLYWAKSESRESLPQI